MGNPVDRTRVFDLGNDGYKVETEIHQYVGDILAQNKLERETSNGFSDGRTMRKIMSISTVEMLNALQKGYKLDTNDKAELAKEVRRYLRDEGRDKGYQTVNYIDTPGHTGRIIVK